MVLRGPWSLIQTIKDQFGIDVDCYVLDGPAKTAVVSQRGMAQALGLSKRGDRLTVFAGSKTMDGYLGRDLREKLVNPIIFQRESAAAENSVGARAHGYDATILIDLCNAIIAARKDDAPKFKLTHYQQAKTRANPQAHKPTNGHGIA